MATSETRKCQRCSKNRQLRFYSTPRGRVCITCKRKVRREGARRSHVKRTYGLTPQQHDDLLQYQEFVCAICRQSRTYKLNVDHDHKLPEGVDSVRGLLCRRCNSLLRKAGDNVFILTSAANYLTFPPAREVRRGLPRT